MVFGDRHDPVLTAILGSLLHVCCTPVEGTHLRCQAIDIAQAAVGSEADAFAGAAGERFRTGRHEAEYFDPDRPAEKTENDAHWGMEKATGAIAAVTSALS